MKKKNLAVLLLCGFLMVSGCYYYAPPPYVATSSPSPYGSYDYIWDSAMRAAQEAGIQITSTNRNAGTILGHRDTVNVTIQVAQQSDGRTRVELSAQGAQAGSSAVADDFYRAYDRYMKRK